jgi:signal transduction histidine kinase
MKKTLRAQLYKTLFTVYYQLKDYQKAIAFAIAYKQTAEDLVQRSETNKLRFMEREIQSIQRQQELERTKLELQYAEENQQLLRRQILGFTIAAALLSILLISLVVAYRRIQKSRAELAQQKAFIEEQHQELEVLNANKDQLFAIIGHDLQGPVGNLSNLLTFIPAEGDVITEESQEILDIAQQGLLESLDLLENLLIWAKEQKEDFSIKREVQKILPYIEQIEQLYAPLIRQRNIQFDYVMRPDITASFDRNTFKTVVRNIVSNGIKYIPEGSVIRYTAKEEGDRLRLIIEDSGSGIPKEVMEALQSDESADHKLLKKKNKGDLGLGLRMSRDFVRANGGDMKIMANGELGGACFDITLPLV